MFILFCVVIFIQIRYFICFLNLYKKIPLYFQINPSYLDFGSFYLPNVSLGYNYRENISCYLENGFLSYRPNRIWHEGSYSCLFGSLIWYPDSAIPRAVVYFLEFLSLMSINKYTNKNRNVWALMALNSTKITKSSLLSDPRVERDPRFPGLFSTLDDGYELFWFKGINQRIPFLYTAIKQKWFDEEFLKNRHLTPDKRLNFSGMYAAGTNFICWAQCNLRIFDYFDFWGKSDADLRFTNKKFIEKGELIPLSKMYKNKISMFGCNHVIDHYVIMQNLFRMTFEHLKNLDQKCGRIKHLKVHSISKGFLFSERQAIPGFFQIGWLGLFSSAEVKSFTDSWFFYKYGIKVWRWGDQQYSLLTSALFESDPKKRIGIWPFERICYPYSNKSGNPGKYLKNAMKDLKFIKKTNRSKEKILIDYVK